MNPDASQVSWLRRYWLAIAAAVVVSGLAAFVFLGPYLALVKLKNGVEARDAEKVSECLDYPALRASLKGQLQSAVSARLGPDNPLAALAAGLAVTVGDGFVDRLVTPEGLASLMAGQEPALTPRAPSATGAAARELLAGATYGYESFGEFAVSVPTQGGQIRFVLTRDGLGWKLSRIEIPPLG